ncbi:MAG: hypothetical protein M3O62_11455 [Pseudomonadota bacterium]|nr:hypothetical protein [Pseudomonadota bacterium]
MRNAELPAASAGGFGDYTGAQTRATKPWPDLEMMQGPPVADQKDMQMAPTGAGPASA